MSSKSYRHSAVPNRLFIAFFNVSHKRPTFAFMGESEYTLGFQRRIAHEGTHGETGASPPSATAWSCATSEITLYAVFVTPDSAALLYTYISRFSENPHHQQQLYLRPSFIPIFNFSHKRPTFAFTGESGYTLGSPKKIAHKGTHGETRGVLDGGWYHYPRSVPHVHQHPRAGYQNGKFCRFWGLVGGAPKERRKPSEQRCAYARRCSEASRPRWAALSCRYCVNDKKYDQSVGRFTTLLIRRNRWLPIFQPRLVDFWRAFW